MSHLVAHYEPPDQDLRCLQIQLYASLVPKEFIVEIHIPSEISATYLRLVC